MDGIGICTKCGTIERTKEDWDTHVCPQPLKGSCTQPTDVQQLKAEIAALCNSFVKGRRDLFLDEFASKYERLRQLSAV